MHLPPTASALSRASARGWPPSWTSTFENAPEGTDPDKEHDLQNWSSLIGIITAICGNLLIALALNVQRYAHLRLNRKRAQIRERAKQALKNAANGGGPQNGYGAAGTNGNLSGTYTPRASDDSIDVAETEPLTRSFHSDDSHWDQDEAGEEIKVASTYLKDPYWWLGQVLITVGEMGNFLAYGFAPASIVSPLGVVALVSNCIIAPIFFNEVFRRRDFLGVVIAVGGAVTVVLSAKTEETKLGPHEVWGAITTMEFEIYMGISCALIALLMWLSPRYGNRTILIDLGLVGLFGGYTALATKGVSSMLSSTLFGAFTTPVTYALLFVLLSTAIMQVRYVNKALQRFDSTQVIPIQFVLFTLSVIIGSAVLYRDFERTTREQATKFIGGCFLTFFGVFLITSGRSRQDDDEDVLSDVEGVEETIGLAEQPIGSPQTPRKFPSRRPSDSVRSRRSSRASRSSYKESNAAILAVGSGFPTMRLPPTGGGPSNTPSAKPAILVEDDSDDLLLPHNPWMSHETSVQQHPGLGPHTISSDSVISVTSAPEGNFNQLQRQGVLARTPPGLPVMNTAAASASSLPADHHQRPVTPRGPPPAAGGLSSTTPSRPHSHMISPSPFSTALGAVVADRILPHLESPTSARKVSTRRSKPGLRNSLYVPQDEVTDEEDERVDGGGSSVGERRSLFGGELFSSRSHNDSVVSETTGGTESMQGSTRAGGGGGRISLRGRARSLSSTLGELFGVGGSKQRREGSRRNTYDDTNYTTDDGRGSLLAGPATITPRRTAPAGGSTETL